MAEATTSGRRSFWPTALLGAGGAGVATYAGHQDWVTLKSWFSYSAHGPAASNLDSPATTALGLVALAAWGVVLVTRGVVRRGVAVLAGLALVGAVPGILNTRHHLLTTQSAHGTAWPWVALAGCVLGLVAAVVAVLKAPRWPEMGAKYDAPAGSPAAPSGRVAPVEEQSSLDLWKSLDEGRDPTGE